MLSSTVILDVYTPMTNLTKGYKATASVQAAKADIDNGPTAKVYLIGSDSKSTRTWSSSRSLDPNHPVPQALEDLTFCAAQASTDLLCCVCPNQRQHQGRSSGPAPASSHKPHLRLAAPFNLFNNCYISHLRPELLLSAVDAWVGLDCFVQMIASEAVCLWSHLGMQQLCSHSELYIQDFTCMLLILVSRVASCWCSPPLLEMPQTSMFIVLLLNRIATTAERCSYCCSLSIVAQGDSLLIEHAVV